MKLLAKTVLGLAALAVIVPIRADEAAARAAIEKLGGQILGIAKDVEGVRVLIPHKTFDGRKLQDDDLAVLKEIPNVWELDVKWSEITDAGLAHVAPLSELRRLHLEKTKVTDAGLEHLKDLGHLEYLNLYGTGVSDAGLDKLKGLTSLTRLFLWDTQVTEEGAKTFHAAMEAAGARSLDINLGWGKDLLNSETLARLAEQRAVADAEAAAEEERIAAEKRAAARQPNIANFLLAAVDPASQDKVRAAVEAEVADEEAAKLAREQEAAAAKGSPGFAEVFAVLDARCVECHGEKKQKAGLRLDTLAAVLRGGDDGPVLVAGKSGESSLFQRVTLPADHDDIMPPKGDPLTAEQIALLKQWIDDGAPEEGSKPGKAVTAAPDLDAVESPTYEEHVAAILESRCVECHGAEKQKGDLRLDSLINIFRGGDDGPAVIARQPDKSPLLHRVSLPADDDDVMPPKGDPLTAAQVGLLKRWIEKGAF